MKYQFSYSDDLKNIVVEAPDTASLDELLDVFQSYLNAVGFSVDPDSRLHFVVEPE